MNEYEESYTSTRDIDWFGVINGHYIHVASCCGILPVEVNDRTSLRDLQFEVAMLDDIQNIDGSTITISHNNQYLQRRFGNYENGGETIELYKKSFDSFARKGFWSFDKENINDPEDSNYRLISWPSGNVCPKLKSTIKFINESDSVDFDNPELIESVNMLQL